MSGERLEQAYAECLRITGEQARNFSWGIRLLPSDKRRALSAVYAVARRIDDIGDGDLPAQQKLDALAEARAGVTDPDRYPDDLVLVALADAARRFPIPLDAFADLIDGCEFDVTGVQIVTTEDLLRYCRWVAGSIGRLSLGVFAPPLPSEQLHEATKLADSLGVALQLTNILRDVREDLTMGRIYLPEQDLKLFSCQLELGPDSTVDPQDGRLIELIRYEAARAWTWYDEGLQLLNVLDRRSAACTAAMAGIYAELLNRISRRPEVVLRERASLPGRAKARVAFGSLVRGGRYAG